MLTALECHIEVNQGFQKVASNIYDYFQPEEIDWVLNKNVDRFIEKCIKRKPNGAFEINQVFADDIQALIKKNVNLTVFRSNAREAYGVLPRDYKYLINDRSIIVSDCTTGFNTTTTNRSEFVGVLNFPDSNRIATPYYASFIITINGVVEFNVANYKISTGLNSVNEKFVLIHLVLEELTKKGYKIYWERYRDLYEANSFIIVSDTVTTGSLLVDTVTTTLVSTETVYQTFMAGSESEVPNRLTNSAALYNVLDTNVYYKTIPRSPVSNLADDRLFIFYSERFIVNTLVIDYIRKPRKISLILDQSSELSEDALRKVCDLSVEYLKNIIESPAYQLKLQDNMVRME